MSFARPAPELIQQLSQFSAATVHEALGRIGAIDSTIKPLSPRFKVCGPAFPVQGAPADNLALHHAIYRAEPGDVLVVSVGGYDEAGYWGDILTNAAQHQRLGGLVFDGGVRDTAILTQGDFPIFCQNICIKGTSKAHPGVFDQPLAFAGVLIHPGDVILGDADGLVVVPAARLEEAVKLSAEREAKEARILQELHNKSTLEIYNFSK